MPASDLTEGLYYEPIYDRRGKCNVHFLVEAPEPDERAAHNKGKMKIKGNKPIDNTYANNVFFGAKKVKGIKLCVKNGEGQWDEGLLADGKPFSSDKNDEEYYRKDWRDLLAQHRPDLLQSLGNVLFNSSMDGLNIDDDDKEQNLSDLGITIPGAASGTAEGEGDKKLPLADESASGGT